MTTTYSVRVAAFTAAIAITALVHGTLLWSFDTVAQEANVARHSSITATTQAVAGHQS